ncbi:drug resistance transporter, EmrB/QacA protein [Arthrobacter sp. Hiyo8]|nr:drug resistance transporter, EmrB/QacA protein [Arthrobacter sp. Hiyo8]
MPRLRACWRTGSAPGAGIRRDGLAAAALAVLVFSTHDLWVTAAALAAMGLGLGLFTPANNASVAAAGHDHQAGMVSGVLNMTRGVGTSLGVALGAVAYSLANTLGNTALATAPAPRRFPDSASGWPWHSSRSWVPRQQSCHSWDGAPAPGLFRARKRPGTCLTTGPPTKAADHVPPCP